MTTHVTDLVLDPLASDPSPLEDGQVWSNSADDRVKARLNGATQVLSHKAELDTHKATANEDHGITLEQARTAGNTLAGAIDMNGSAVQNVGGSASTDAASRGYVADQVNSKLRGLDWQESVLDRYDPTSGLPAHGAGDRYLSTATANGWTQNYIYESDGASWTETAPDEGTATLVEDEDLLYIYDGASWGQFGSAIDHGALTGNGDDDHTQYLLASGARAMSGDLDMGANDVTNVGLVDGVDVSDHSARHDPGGADALTTAAPAQGIGGGNTEGTAGSFARSDHDHKLRTTTGPTDLTIGAIADGEYVKRVGSVLQGAAAGGFLEQKAGRVLQAAFSGNPKKATVTFSTAMSTANYSVQLTPEGTGGFSPYTENKTTAGFDINANANNITRLVLMGWLATVDGET